MKKALIIENGLVAQVEVTEFPVASPYYWVECPDNVTAGYKYDGTNFIAPVDPMHTKERNKERAIEKLEESDFAVLPDVNLVNKSEWEAYRSAVRKIASNPTDGKVTWPKKPQTIWE